MLRQNDAVGLVLFDSAVRTYLPPKARPTQFRRVLELLEPEAASGDTDMGTVLNEVAERIRKRGLVILISDLIDDVDKIGTVWDTFGTIITKSSSFMSWMMQN